MKKYISIVLSNILLLCFTICSLTISVGAITKEWIHTNSEGTYTYQIFEGKYARLIEYLGEDTDSSSYYNIPKYVDGYVVKYLGEYLYANHDVPAKNVVIPDTVVKIENSVFRYSEEGKDVLEYDNNPYSQNLIIPSQLETIVIPESVVYIGDKAFKDCENLKEIILPDSLIYLGNQAFYNCKSLKNITVPGTIRTIQKETFQNCTKLKNLNINLGIEKICERAFMNCNSLNNIEIPVTTTFIKEKAFFNCKKLNNVQLHDTTYLAANDRAFGFYANKNKKINKVKELHFDCIISLDNDLSCGAISYAKTYGFTSTCILGKREIARIIVDEPGNVYSLNYYNSKVISWISSKPQIATITENGKLTTLKKGVTILTAKLENGTSYTVKLKVRYNPQIKYKAQSDKYYKAVNNITLKVGETKKLVTVYKADAVKNIYKDTNKAKITGNGESKYFKVTGLKRGTTTLKITVNGKMLKLKIKVK